MEKSVDLSFNPKISTLMHIDLNSCFATVEQQANPFLRGVPVAVAAYLSPRGCVLAASVEAKLRGVRTGMRVVDGRRLCPNLVVVSSDPNKYRTVHLRLKRLLEEYTDKVTPKSIDEFVIDLEGTPAYQMGMMNVAKEIKERIKLEIGEWLTVSIGIGPNRFLAKTAAGLHKPNGLDEICADNFEQIYKGMELNDLCGIKTNNIIRLNSQGIYTVWGFYLAGVSKLRLAFESIVGYYWYIRLHGFEVDDVVFSRKSYGNSYSLPRELATPEELAPILRKLVEKTGARMRRGGYRALGVHIALLYRDGSYWHKGRSLGDLLYDSGDIYRIAFRLLVSSPYKKPVRTLAVSCFDLQRCKHTQLSLLDDVGKKERLVRAMDEVNARWGNFVIMPAIMLGTENNVPDRVSFGGIKELVDIE